MKNQFDLTPLKGFSCSQMAEPFGLREFKESDIAQGSMAIVIDGPTGRPRAVSVIKDEGCTGPGNIRMILCYLETEYVPRALPMSALQACSEGLTLACMTYWQVIGAPIKPFTIENGGARLKAQCNVTWEVQIEYSEDGESMSADCGYDPDTMDWYVTEFVAGTNKQPGEFPWIKVLSLVEIAGRIRGSKEVRPC